MPAPTVTLPTTGTDPKIATKAGLEGAIDAALEELHDDVQTRATAASVTALTATVNGKAPIASPAFTGTVTGITKGMVGLGNVDNVSDANKPVSSPQQAALNALADELKSGGASGGSDAAARPGDFREAFASGLVGDWSALPDVAGTVVADADMGNSLQIAGAGIVAVRRAVPVLPGRYYQARWVFKRTVDTNDPLGDAVVLGVQYLSAEQAAIGAYTSPLNVLVNQGVRISGPVTFSLDMPGVDVVLPVGTKYVRQYFRTLGSTPVTRLGWLVFEDITSSATDDDVVAAEAAAAEAEFQAGIATAQAGMSSTQAGISTNGATVSGINAATALAAANASGATTVYATKALADAALAGLAANTVVEVSIDESRSGSRSRYRKTGGVYVFELELADMTRRQQVARDGVPGTPRFTLTTLAHFDTLALGARNVTSIPYLPLNETLSQSGTTVTAPFGRFTRDHIGGMIYWPTGEQAMIVDVPIVNWPSASLTCTVDRSQTISAAAAVVKPKHLVGAFHGDSVAWRHAPAMNHSLWRALGFGGTVTHANSVETTDGSNIAQVTLAGSARDATGDNDFANFPWGQHWEIPADSSVTVQLLPQYLNAVKRNPRHGLEPYETAFDTAIIIWRRAAGAFVVERKRVNDVAYELIDTIGDASSGSTKYGFRKYSHALRSDWMYRIRSTSGTIEVQSVVFRNDSQHGYVYWPVFRGGRLLSEFNQLPSADLAEIARIVGVPDFITTIAYDTVGGQVQTQDYLEEIEDNRAVWRAAAPYMDFVWLEGWQAATTAPEQSAWNRAIVQTALANSDSLVSFEEFFGPFAASGFRWQEDSIHPGYTGGAVIAHRVMETLGVFDFSTLDSGRNVNAREGDFVELRARQMDVRQAIIALNRQSGPERGLKWTTDFAGPFVGAAAMGGAIGAGDFTVSLHLEVKDPSAQMFLFSINSNPYVPNTAGTLLAYLSTTSLVLELKNSSNQTYQYFYQYFNDIYNGQTGILTIRSDVANDRFDLFWNGEPVAELTATVSALGGGDPLGTWVGTGTDFALQSSTTMANNVPFHHAMAWRSRLTDAQIRAIAHADAPAGTNPDFWWNFDEGIGRLTLDKSGNDKHGMILRSGNAYLIEPNRLVWSSPKRGVLGPSFVMNVNQEVSMLPGDNVIAAFTANRDMRLPATAAVGDVFRVTVNSTSTIRITQNAGQRIRSGVSATTAGTGGSVTIPNWSSVALRCVVGGASTVWVIESHTGAALTLA